MKKPLNVLDLDKRQRLALRQALARGIASAPTPHVNKLVKLGLATRTGHWYEATAWGKATRREPLFFLTAAGEEAAKAILATLAKQD